MVTNHKRLRRKGRMGKPGIFLGAIRGIMVFFVLYEMFMIATCIKMIEGRIWENSHSVWSGFITHILA